MAEFVETDLETKLEILERLIAVEIFTPNEMRKIAIQLRENSYRIQKKTKDKADFLKYIRYEKDLLRQIRERRKKSGNKARIREIDLLLAERLQQFFRSTLERYLSDLDLWKDYFGFCANRHFFIVGRKMLQRLVQVHGDKPHVWIFASQWSLKKKKDEKCDWEAARTWLVRGIQRHPKDKELYKSLVKFDLELAELAAQGAEENKDDEKSSDKYLACAEVSYKNAIKNITDAQFAADLAALIGQYPQAKELLKLAVSNLEKEFDNSEESWNGRAILAYEQAQPPEPLEPKQLIAYRVEKCLEIFQEAVKKLPTKPMWQKYLHFLRKGIKLHQDIVDLKFVLFKRALPDAQREGFVDPEDISELADDFFSSGKHVKAIGILKDGIEKYPTSALLWYDLIRIHLSLGNDEEAETIFEKAADALKDLPAKETCRIWNMMIGTYLEVDGSIVKLEELFLRGLKYRTDLAQLLKPKYLAWRFSSQGIEKARELVHNSYVINPPCLEFYQKLIEIESKTSVPDVVKTRQHYETALRMFGATNPDIWMSYMNFERSHGDIKLVSKIYERAIRNLEKNFVDKFVENYALSG